MMTERLGRGIGLPMKRTKPESDFRGGIGGGKRVTGEKVPIFQTQLGGEFE